MGRVFPSERISFKSTSNYVKLLSVQPLVAFKFISLKTVDNRVNLVESTYNRVSASTDIVSYTCACEKLLCQHPISCPPYCLLLLTLHIALPIAISWRNRQDIQFDKQLECVLIHRAMSILYNF